jgi:hypothetical protein
VIPVGAMMVWGCKELVQYLFSETMYIPKLMVSAGIFTISFFVLLLLVDGEIRDIVKLLKDKFILTPYYKLRKI